MEFSNITADLAVNEHGNIHVVCSRRGSGCFMPNQVINTAMTETERQQSVAALNSVGWRVGSDKNIYCPPCVQAIGNE